MKLFTPFRVREIELRNWIVMSPMCEYSAKEGHPQPWHMVHLGSRAVGGAGLVMTEASAVEERGRISAEDAGIYDDAHIASWRPIAEFVKGQGAVVGMQLAHAGRKGSTAPPWAGARVCRSPMAAGSRLLQAKRHSIRDTRYRASWNGMRFVGSPQHSEERLSARWRPGSR